MSYMIAFLKAFGYPASGRGFTRYFFLSGLLLAGSFSYVWLWSDLSQRLTGDDCFAIGKPAEVAVALNGGGLVASFMLIGFFWLLLAGFAARGAALRERDRRIAEMEAKLNGKIADKTD